MLKLIAPLSEKQPVRSNVRGSESEPENIPVAGTSTPVKAYTATTSKTTPNSSRNNCFSLNKSITFFVIENKK